jgi:hypothetical protein
VLDRDLYSLAQLVEILRIGELRALLEPFRRQCLGRHAFAGATVLETDAHPHDRLRAVRNGYHAEAKRQAQLEVALEAIDGLDTDFHEISSSRPCT